MRKAEFCKKDYNPNEWDESRSTLVTPEKRKQAELSTSIRLPMWMANQLRKIATKKGDIGYQTLIKIWIAERLEVETKTKKRA
jgi:uncharacterized protein YjaZ